MKMMKRVKEVLNQECSINGIGRIASAFVIMCGIISFIIAKCNGENITAEIFMTLFGLYLYYLNTPKKSEKNKRG